MRRTEIVCRREGTAERGAPPPRRQLRRRNRLASCRRYAGQFSEGARIEQDHALLAPRALCGNTFDSRQALRFPAAEVDALQFVSGEKAEGTAVRRPEGIDRVISAGQRLR